MAPTMRQTVTMCLDGTIKNGPLVSPAMVLGHTTPISMIKQRSYGKARLRHMSYTLLCSWRQADKNRVRLVDSRTKTPDGKPIETEGCPSLSHLYH
jgi:hypothetical protein